MTTAVPSNLELGNELMRQPLAFPERPAAVERLDTHISMIFFSANTVYKVKKALSTPFLDFSTLELRRFFCEEEVRLNQRLAPSVYRRVVPIRRCGDQLAVGPAAATEADEGQVVDYAVEMERLPRSQMWDQRLDRGEVDNAEVHEIVALLTRFHASAATGEGVDEFGSPQAIGEVVLENVLELTPFIEQRVLTPKLQRFLQKHAELFLQKERVLLESRVRTKKIRDGHGDLHTANICVRDSGSGYDIVVYDCIEFAPRFRCADVAADLAFLAMDLDHKGFRGFSRYLVKRYRDATGDAELLPLLDFYKGHRALVRAKVEAMQVASCAESDARQARLERARSYVHLAVTYAFPRVLILTCGLPGSGKSWAGKSVARTFEAVRLVSDEVRYQMPQAGAESSQSRGFDAGHYAPERVQAVYDELLRRARTALSDNRSVVVDASFGSAARRKEFQQLGAELGVPVVTLYRRCDESQANERSTRRAADIDEPSEADAAVRQHLARTFEVPVDEPHAPCVEVAHVESASDVVTALLERLCDSFADG